jgi:hypothetical protein
LSSVSHDPGSGLAGVRFVKESYVVPADVQYEARTTNPRQFSGLKFGVNLKHDKCAVVPNRVYSVANLGNSFFRHADSFPQSRTLALPLWISAEQDGYTITFLGSNGYESGALATAT